MSNVYVLPDDRGRIIRCEGGYTMSNIDDLSQWTLIDSGEGDRYNLCQSNYFPGGIYDDNGIPRYKLEGGKAVRRTEAEIAADLAGMEEDVQGDAVTLEELAKENKELSARLEAAIQANANLEDCLVEMAEIVYA